MAANLVEGCARATKRDYLHFVGIAIGSASETRYLIDLASRLGFLPSADAARIATAYAGVIRALQALVTTLSSA